MCIITGWLINSNVNAKCPNPCWYYNNAKYRLLTLQFCTYHVRIDFSITLHKTLQKVPFNGLFFQFFSRGDISTDPPRESPPHMTYPNLTPGYYWYRPNISWFFCFIRFKLQINESFYCEEFIRNEMCFHSFIQAPLTIKSGLSASI